MKEMEFYGKSEIYMIGFKHGAVLATGVCLAIAALLSLI